MTLEERVSRLEQQQHLATKADLIELRDDVRRDLAEVRVELSRDIANLAAGIGGDLRAMRTDIDGMRQDLAGIRALLERRHRWPWERRP